VGSRRGTCWARTPSRSSSSPPSRSHLRHGLLVAKLLEVPDMQVDPWAHYSSSHRKVASLRIDFHVSLCIDFHVDIKAVRLIFHIASWPHAG
jgi:hypothetical protein